jgi:hypothetical protein
MLFAVVFPKLFLPCLCFQSNIPRLSANKLDLDYIKLHKTLKIRLIFLCACKHSMVCSLLCCAVRCCYVPTPLTLMRTAQACCLPTVAIASHFQLKFH